MCRNGKFSDTNMVCVLRKRREVIKDRIEIRNHYCLLGSKTWIHIQGGKSERLLNPCITLKVFDKKKGKILKMKFSQSFTTFWILLLAKRDVLWPSYFRNSLSKHKRGSVLT